MSQALQSVNKESSAIAKELREVEKALKLDPTNVDILAQKQELLGKSVETAAEKVQKLHDVQAQVEEQFKSGKISGEAYRDFQREVVAAEATLRKAESAVDDFGKQANESADNVEDLATETEKSADAADDAGGRFEQLGSILGAVGGAIAATVVAVGAAAGAAVSAMVDMSKEAALYADDMLTLSTQTGVSTETLQAYSYAAELVDVSLDTLTGSMAKQLKSMSSAAQGSASYVEAYERLGVAVTDADGNLRDSEEVYWEVIDALGQMENETERDSLAMTLLGKSAQDLNPLIELGADALDELMQEAKDAGAVLSEDTLNSLLEVSDAMERMNSSTEAARNNLGTISASALAEYYNGATDIIQNFTKIVQTAAEGGEVGEELITGLTDSIVGMVEGVAAELPTILDTVGVIFESVITAVGDAMPSVVETISTYLPELLSTVSDMLPELLDIVADIFVAVVAAIVDVLPEILECGVEVITSLISGISEALPELIPAAVEAITTIIQGLVDQLPQILEAALQIILALAEGLLNALPQLIEALPEIITGIVDFLIGSIPMLVETGVALLTSLVDALPEIIDAIVDVLPQLIDGIIDALLDSLPLLIEAGITLFIALVENIPAIIAGIAKAIPKIITGIVDAIVGNTGKIADAGKQLISGLWEGISDAKQWLMDKVGGFFDGVVSGIKDFFGIHSPSTLFRDEIGKYLAEGIGEGFTDEMDSISKDMQDAIPTNFDAAVNAAYKFSVEDDGERNFELVTPISIGGQKLTKVISRVQYNTKINRARVVGVTAE